jgi:phosphatidate cytidylyltransferase
MKTILTRIFSAAVALAIFFYVYFVFKHDGLKFLCLLVSLLGTIEVSKLLFLGSERIFLRILFTVSVLLNFLVTAYHQQFQFLAFSSLAVLFLCSSILFESEFKELSELSAFQAKGILGIFYAGSLPGFAAQTLDFENGLSWFLTMLAIVFIGDTFAYIAGMLLGDKKILPRISPKKTLVGAWGGLIGSLVAAAYCSQWFTFPIWTFLVMGATAGLIAQLGDMFESLLKRVANAKDSGSIMPGHGGILDRIDGVLFAAPIVVLFATALTQLF